ncbi:MAG TPA: metal-dependent hydrolase [Verrucomicrobiae bacterium]|nr:metal-dependent hydrolase [Verrucomicrobiae bacterium]
MDPISHGLIGAGVAALSGQPFAWDNPIFLGSILGSMAPDLDIVMQARGKLAYLKHHRGISHSVPGLLGFSAAISLGLALFFPGYSFWQIFLWTFAGTLSHSIFDLLNSYGARLLWPFVKRRLTINFIMLTDPVILGSFFLAFLFREYRFLTPLAFIISGLYLLGRWKSKQTAFRIVQGKFDIESDKVLILPDMYRPFNWNFVVENETEFVTGRVLLGKSGILIREVLDKHDHPSIEAAEDSPLGEMFREFTPFYHITHKPGPDCHEVCYSDLRYPSKKGYIYTGTAKVDEDGELLEAVFKPYNSKKGVKVA